MGRGIRFSSLSRMDVHFMSVDVYRWAKWETWQLFQKIVVCWQKGCLHDGKATGIDLRLARFLVATVPAPPRFDIGIPTNW